MRVLRSIVLPPTTLMVLLDAEVASRGAIRSQVVSDQSIGHETVFLKQLAHELQRGMLVPFRLDQDIEDLALGIDGAPQVDHAAIDLHIDLIQVPTRVGFGAAFTQVRRDHRPEVVYPAPNGLVGDRNAAFCQQVFDVAQAQREPEVEPDRLLNDLGRESVAAVADSLHPVGYRAARGTATSQAT